MDVLVEDLAANLGGCAFKVAALVDTWLLRTRSAYPVSVRAAADVGEQDLDLREYDVAVQVAMPTTSLSPAKG